MNRRRAPLSLAWRDRLEPPTGGDWLHEIKYDGYRMHARIDSGQVKLLSRMGLDWSHRTRALSTRSPP